MLKTEVHDSFVVHFTSTVKVAVIVLNSPKNHVVMSFYYILVTAISLKSITNNKGYYAYYVFKVFS